MSDAYTPEELADDGSEARRMLGNATVCLWDINRAQLTPRETARLDTILRKIADLQDIIREREIAEQST